MAVVTVAEKVVYWVDMKAAAMVDMMAFYSVESMAAWRADKSVVLMEAMLVEH